jgi:hypothetical protein
MTTTVPTMWMLILLALGALAASGLALAVRRRGSGSVLRTSAPATTAVIRSTVAAGPGVSDATPRAEDAEPDATAPESERAMLRRLCAPAFADATALAARPAASHAAAVAAATDVLSRIDAHPRYVPRRPQLLPQLSRAINDPAASAASIAAILAQDPALAGNLLRIANSATYRRRAAPVEQLERAVALLGTEGLRRTVMAALLQPVITDDGSVFARCAQRLWDHTLRSAGIAEDRPRQASRDDLHAAQLLALLYGLGSVVVVQVLRDIWTRRVDGVPDADTVAMLLDTWSVRCARSISADWGLSARVRQALDELERDRDGTALGPLGHLLRGSRAQAAVDAEECATVEAAGA